MYEDYKTTSNDEAIIRIIGKLTLAFPDIEQNLDKQLKIKSVIEEVLYNYDVLTKETGLVASDLHDKIKMYLAVRKLARLSPNTLDNYERELYRFSSFLVKPVSAISTNDIRMYLAFVSRNNMKGSSLNTIIYTLKSFFKWLVEEEYLIKNPMGKIKVAKTSKKLRQALSLEETEKVKQACKTQREAALLHFIYSTGCRVSEVASLNKSHVNWADMSLYVIGKGNKERKVYFSVSAKLFLEEYLTTRKDENPALFVSGKHPHGRLGVRSIEKEISKIAIRAGLDKSVFPHLLRHSYATHRLNAGMNITSLQALLGHSDPATTQIYASLAASNIEHEYRKTT